MYTKNSTLLLKLLTGYRIGFSSLFIQIFNNTFSKIKILNGFILQIEINLKYLFSTIFFLKKHSLCLFKLLIDITSYEFLGNKYRYILIYSLLNIETSLRIILKVKLKEYNTSLLSVSSIFCSANWSEREIFDFFGIYFFFNKDLRRILLDYGFRGYPLRKDFPLTGFIELFYDDTIKKITYEKLTLTQEYRTFFYNKNHINSLNK